MRTLRYIKQVEGKVRKDNKEGCVEQNKILILDE